MINMKEVGNEFELGDVVQVVNTVDFYNIHGTGGDEYDLTHRFYESLGLVVEADKGPQQKYLVELYDKGFRKGDEVVDTWWFHNYNLNYIGRL